LPDDTKQEEAWIGLHRRIDLLEREVDSHNRYWDELEIIHDRIDRIEAGLTIIVAVVAGVGLEKILGSETWLDLAAVILLPIAILVWQVRIWMRDEAHRNERRRTMIRGLSTE